MFVNKKAALGGQAREAAAIVQHDSLYRQTWPHVNPARRKFPGRDRAPARPPQPPAPAPRPAASSETTSLGATWLARAERVLVALMVNLQTGVHLDRRDRRAGWAMFDGLLRKYVTVKHASEVA